MVKNSHLGERKIDTPSSYLCACEPKKEPKWKVAWVQENWSWLQNNKAEFHCFAHQAAQNFKQKFQLIRLDTLTETKLQRE